MGERLPSVEQMAHDMQVSKPTVGEAIRVLSECGVVKSRRGVNGGVTVVEDNIPTTLLLAHEGPGEPTPARAARGPPAGGDGDRAAGGGRAVAGDLEAMEDSIDRLVEQPAATDWTVRLHFDHFFHYAMGRAARSDLLAYYQHQILEGITVVCAGLLRAVGGSGRWSRPAPPHARCDPRRRERPTSTQVMDEHLALPRARVDAGESRCPHVAAQTPAAQMTRILPYCRGA